MYPSPIWHPCAQMHDYEDFPPLEVVAAHGTTLTLADGSTLYDTFSSWWCKSLGHGHPAIRDAVHDQLDRFEHVITANVTHAGLEQLATRLAALLPGAGAGGKVFFADNGSTGVEVALKMALQAQAQRGQPQRVKLAALANGYHGETAGAMSVSDVDLYKSPHGPLMFETLKLGPLPCRAGPHDPQWLDASEEWPAIESQLNGEADAVAAIIFEPVVQGAGGMMLYSPDLLTRLRRWADAHGVYLIADEIASGFYRTGTRLAWDHSNASPPDFVVLSKGLTAGVGPMSVVIAPQSIYELFYAPYHTGKAFMHSNTYAGWALGVAAANAALDVYERDDIAGHVATVGPRLRAGLEALADDRPWLRNGRGVGMVAAADLTQPDGSPLPREHRTGYRVYREAIRRGALLRPLGDTLYLFPPLTTTANEAEAMLAILREAADAVMSDR